MRISKIIHTWFLIVIFILLLVSELFDISILKYTDEIIEIFCLFYLLYTLQIKENFYFLIGILCIFIIGIIGNLFSRYDRTFIMIVEDFLLILKFPIIFISLMSFSNQKLTKCKHKKSINILFKFACLFTLIVFANCFYKYLTVGGRVAFLNNTYAGTAGLFSVLFSYIIFSYYRIKKIVLPIYAYLFLGMNFVTTIITQSNISILIFIIMTGYFIYERVFEPKIKGNYLLFICLFVVSALAFLVSYNKLVAYFTTKNAPRYLFLSNSFSLANKYFPFGVGFGLFGSTIAERYYSPVYYDLGFNEIWGVMPGQFLNDTFYPTILGELGYFGLLIYMLFLLSCYKNISGVKNNINFNRIVLLAFLVSGFTSNFFNSAIGTCFAVSFVIFNVHPKNIQKNYRKIGLNNI